MSGLLATGLGKRYRNRWALRDCSLQVPQGRIVALVGPNGSGKTTLLHLAAGLLAPTEGQIAVDGHVAGRSRELVGRIALVAQDAPLYGSFTVRETLDLGRHMNPRWDQQLAGSRLDRLGIPRAQKVGELSGGQRAQVALALALGKRPDVLLLDEPLASLDPLARRDFMRTLMDCAAETSPTIILSSHLVADLERTCDYLILLSASRTQIAGDIDDLINCHRVLSGARTDDRPIAGVASIVDATGTDRQSTLLVRTDGPIHDRAWTVDRVGLEELVLAYLSNPDASAFPRPAIAAAPQPMHA